MKRIGFVDYYIGNWHSNNYPQWIADACKELNLEYEVAYAYAMIDSLPTGDSQLTTDDWCEKFGVEKCNTIEEIVEKSDYLFVLSPNNPEYHEELCQLVLKSGKPTYVDKTFAPDGPTAKRIVDIAEKNNTPMFSSSALRFSNEMIEFKKNVASENCEFVMTTGAGALSNYIIHQLEMVTTVMGTGAKRVKCFKTEGARSFVIEYVDGRKATVSQAPSMPFSLSVQAKDGTNHYIANASSEMFYNLMKQILTFFENKEIPVCHKQTIEIMCIREAAFKAFESEDTWVDVVIPQ